MNATLTKTEAWLLDQLKAGGRVTFRQRTRRSNFFLDGTRKQCTSAIYRLHRLRLVQFHRESQSFTIAGPTP